MYILFKWWQPYIYHLYNVHIYVHIKMYKDILNICTSRSSVYPGSPCARCARSWSLMVSCCISWTVWTQVLLICPKWREMCQQRQLEPGRRHSSASHRYRWCHTICSTGGLLLSTTSGSAACQRTGKEIQTPQQDSRPKREMILEFFVNIYFG